LSNYTKSTNFATKDNLTPGDPLKIVRGTEIDTEFNNIATAIATKTDNASAALTGGTINDTTIGATTASTGAFTTISATGAITSTLATGTAPLVVASTTKVTNLNVDSLDGADWASPAALGSTTPAAVSATTLSASGNVTLSGGTANGVAYLNGSKVVTSGSALTWDGSTFYVKPTNAQFVVGATFAKIENLGGASASLIMADTTDSGTIKNVASSIAFINSSSEGMRLTSTGLGIGTSSPTAKLTVAGGRLQVTGNTSPSSGTGIELFYDGTSAGALAFARGTGYIPLAFDGSDIRFNTSSTERARIDSDGNLLVGTTTTGSYFDGKVTSYSANTYPVFAGKQGESAASVMIQWNAGTTGDNIFTYFVTETSPTVRGSISYNRAGGLTAYNTTSDYRAKDISGPVTGSGSLIDSVPVYMGKMKGATQERPMFIAHETPTYAHTGERDAVDADGKPIYQQMDASALIPVMWAEIQSLRKRLADAGIA